MSAGGPACNTNLCGVDVILLAVRPKPSYSGLYIIDRSGKRVFGCETVGDSCCDVTVLSKFTNQTVVSVTRASPKSAAMNAHYRRVGAGSLWVGDVDLQMLIVGVRILDILIKVYRVLRECRS